VVAAPLTTPGGIFAQATNSGRQSRDMFTVVPELQLRLGMNLTPSIRAFVGYEFFYVSNVVRPGDQVDRVLNFTANPAVNGVVAPPPLMGVARPAPMFNQNDFWAQGVSFGLQFRY
jgi:Putative beta barrel porin-7 (BBP7)